MKIKHRTFNIKLNHIYNEDNLITLNRMRNNFIDLTITSPPYNVGLSYDECNDSLDTDSYLLFLKKRFGLIYKKTKIGGRCVINIGDGKNGSIPTHSHIIQLMISLKWVPITTIMWNKNDTSSRFAWGSFCSPSCPSFPTPFEYILVFGKNTKKLNIKGKTDLKNDEFIEWSWAKWDFRPTSKNDNHPAKFPIELPYRCIKMLSYIGNIVYDPFMGSGTTAIASKILKRKYIGSEISKEYCKIANREINNKNNLIKIKTSKKIMHENGITKYLK